jgi:Flp pilus assembly pilin Flp
MKRLWKETLGADLVEHALIVLIIIIICIAGLQLFGHDYCHFWHHLGPAVESAGRVSGHS